MILFFPVNCTFEAVSLPGPSRATAGSGETFSRNPQTFSRSPSGEKIFELFFSKWYIFWRTLYLWPTAGSTNVAGPGVANPHTHPPSRRVWSLLQEQYVKQAYTSPVITETPNWFIEMTTLANSSPIVAFRPIWQVLTLRNYAAATRGQ